jgi:hypothetical protein
MFKSFRMKEKLEHRESIVPWEPVALIVVLPLFPVKTLMLLLFMESLMLPSLPLFKPSVSRGFPFGFIWNHINIDARAPVRGEIDLNIHRPCVLVGPHGTHACNGQ